MATAKTLEEFTLQLCKQDQATSRQLLEVLKNDYWISSLELLQQVSAEQIAGWTKIPEWIRNSIVRGASERSGTRLPVRSLLTDYICRARAVVRQTRCGK